MTTPHVVPNRYAVEKWFCWIGTDGQHYVRQCIDQTNVGPCTLLMLNTNLPSAVQPVEIVPYYDIQSKWYGGYGGDCREFLVPCVTTHGNLSRTSFATDCNANNTFSHDLWLPVMWGKTEPYGGEPFGGDSGMPCWALINNELVLFGTWEGGYGTPILNCPGYDIDAVNEAIAELSQNWGLSEPFDHVTAADLSGFPDVERWHQ